MAIIGALVLVSIAVPVVLGVVAPLAVVFFVYRCAGEGGGGVERRRENGGVLGERPRV